MQTLTTVFFAAAIPFAFLVAYFKFRRKKKLVILCAALCSIMLVLGLVMEQSHTPAAGNNPDENPTVTPGLTPVKPVDSISSRPFLRFVFHCDDDSSFFAAASIGNFGQTSFGKIHYELKDEYTPEFMFRTENHLRSSSKLTKKQTAKRHQFMIEHEKDINKKDSLENLAGNNSWTKQIFGGMVPAGESMLFYTVRISWKKEHYTASYIFFLDENTMAFRLCSLTVNDDNGQPVKDLAAFFPGVPLKDYSITALPEKYVFKSKAKQR
ncbi:MAG: hypothetical protein V4635_02855 [Bacteroidota bacterium]